jgi:predicted Zn-dependent peptidase
MSQTIRVTTLPSGLRVATDTIATVETAAIGVWTNCGSRHETEAVNGVAHMVEHMLFKGTPRRSALAIAEEMEAVGGHMNAYTGRENTAYYARILKDDLPLAIDILADVLQNSLFAPDEIVRERQVILQEIGQTLDTPDDIVFDYFQEAAFPGQAIGRPVLGTADTVSAMGHDDLRGYIGGHYTPSRLVLAASGAVDHDWLVDEAQRLFTTLPDNAEPPTEAATYRGGEIRVESDLEQVHMVLGFAGIDMHDPDYYAAQILSTILGGGSSSRLFQEVREKRGLVYTIQSFLGDSAECGTFGIYAGTGADRLDELMPVLCDESVKATAGFTPAEILRGKAQLKASMLMGLESTYARAEMLALNLLTYDRPIPLAETLARIDAVDDQALARVAKRIFSTTPTLTALGPVKTLEPYDRIAARCRV